MALRLALAFVMSGVFIVLPHVSADCSPDDGTCNAEDEVAMLQAPAANHGHDEDIADVQLQASAHGSAEAAEAVAAATPTPDCLPEFALCMRGDKCCDGLTC